MTRTATCNQQVAAERWPIVDGVEPHVRLRRDAQHEAPVHLGRVLGQRLTRSTLFGEEVDRPRAQRTVHAHVRARSEPAVELLLEVERTGELPARLEAGLEELDEPLDESFGFGVTGRAEVPADLERSQEGGVRVGGLAVAGVERTLAVGDDGLGQPAERSQAARTRRSCLSSLALPMRPSAKTSWRATNISKRCTRNGPAAKRIL